MLYQRRISRIHNVPQLAPGFVGPGHLAAPVIPPEDFALNDPFILLMDDHFDIGDRPLGGPHPHAGFETVTLLLQGSVYDRDEGGFIDTGEVQWMTAGRGIIHGENVGAKGKVRLLQLWLTLPKADRWTEPGFQTIHTDAVPVRQENGAEVRIYSGGSGSLRSKTRNHVPVTITEITLEPHASIDQEIPSSYNGFVFTLRGSIHVGANATTLQTGQTGWLDRPKVDGASLLRVTAGEEGARLVFYAGQPQGNPIVSYGPFIGDSKQDIVRLYTEFQSGQFVSLSKLVKAAV
jgi:redox-sensitive bicupin YhaK (pirin superfamily)